MRKKRWLVAVAMLGVVSFGALPRAALDTVRQIAIQHNGRNKPLDSFARETLEFITGASAVGHDDPVVTVLSIMAEPERWQQEPLLSVPFRPLREPLGMDAKHAKISYNDLVAKRLLMRMLPAIVQKQQREEKLTMLEQETMDAFQRFVTLSNLLEQKLHVVPPPHGASDAVWLSIQQPDGYAPPQQEHIRTAWSSLISAVRAERGDDIIRAARHVSELLQQLNPSAYPARWRLRLELFYNQAAPFQVARAIYLLAILALLVGLSTGAVRWSSVGLALCVWAYLCHGAGMAMRVIIGGRPPVSNFFETTLWLPFVAVTIALILERIYRARPSTALRTVPSKPEGRVEGRYLALSAAILAVILLTLAEHLPLDSSVSPVVAVLRSNLWLTIHVLTIVASYGALGLATVLAHVYAVLYLGRRRRQPALRTLDTLLYRALQVGVVLLASGIMLGAVWANASWGRYWGWDPKETWALITLLWFLAVLHGRFAGWIQGVGVALSTIGGFFLLLMTYYGVSFYLVGLHSYAGGHATPISPLLIAYLITEMIFLLIVGCAALARRRPT